MNQIQQLKAQIITERQKIAQCDMLDTIKAYIMTHTYMPLRSAEDYEKHMAEYQAILTTIQELGKSLMQ